MVDMTVKAELVVKSHLIGTAVQRAVQSAHAAAHRTVHIHAAARQVPATRAMETGMDR